MADRVSIELDANDVWRVLRTFEQALEVLHGQLDDDIKEEPTLDAAYRGYFDLYERFRALSDVLPEPDLVIDEDD